MNRDSGANRLMLPEMSDWGRDRDALDLNRLLLHGRDIVAKANRVMRDQVILIDPIHPAPSYDKRRQTLCRCTIVIFRT